MNRPTLAMHNVKNLNKFKAYLKAKVPVVSVEEVLYHQKPFSEVILHKLCKAQCHRSVNILKYLLEIEENRGGRHFNDIPKLKNNETILELLMVDLINAEVQMQLGCKEEEAIILLKLATKLLNSYEAFLWIANEIFRLSVDAAREFKADGGFIEALVSYRYSNFLYKHVNMLDKALEMGQKSRDLSLGKSNWLLEEEGIPLLKAASKLLHNMLLEKTMQLKTISINEAILTSLQSINVAKDLDEPSSVAESYYTYGVILRLNNRHSKAIESFMTGLDQATAVQNNLLMCKGHYELAVTYKALNNFSDSERQIALTIALSKASDIEEWEGFALKLLAEVCIGQGFFDKAVMELLAAQYIFTRLGMKEEVMQTKFVIGLAKAQKMFPDFIKAIHGNQCSTKELHKLLNWKISRLFQLSLMFIKLSKHNDTN